VAFRSAFIDAAIAERASAMGKKIKDWAKAQDIKGATVKGVFVELAAWAGADGFCKFRRVRDLARSLGVTERSVQRALKRLETPTSEGGLGLIQRVLHHRMDGAQLANGFVLLTWVSAAEGLQRDILSSGGCQIGGGGGVVSVTPYLEIDFKKEESPHSSPASQRARLAMPPDWQVPLVTDLPTLTRALANQWPNGAYATQGEAFHQKALGNGLRRADWNACWAYHVQAVHAEVMRAAKAGVVFVAPARSANRLSPPPKPVLAQAREDVRSARLRKVLQSRLSPSNWERFFAPSAYVFDDPGLKVIATTYAIRDWLETNYSEGLKLAARTVSPDMRWVTFEVEARSGLRLVPEQRRAD
jgi:hypothetical protein